MQRARRFAMHVPVGRRGAPQYERKIEVLRARRYVVTKKCRGRPTAIHARTHTLHDAASAFLAAVHGAEAVDGLEWLAIRDLSQHHLTDKALILCTFARGVLERALAEAPIEPPELRVVAG